MLKTIGRVCKKLLIWVLPLCIVLGLFANVRELDHFNFLEWIQQLPDVMENPLMPLRFAIFNLQECFNNISIKSFIDIFDVVGKIFKMMSLFIYSIGKCIVAVFNDIINFLKWLSLGYF